VTSGRVDRRTKHNGRRGAVKNFPEISLIFLEEKLVSAPAVGRMSHVSIQAAFEVRVGDLGAALARSGRRLLLEIDDCPSGPILFAKRLGLDKATASRLLRALSSSDPLVTVQLIPGPEPLRAFADAARRHGASAAGVAKFSEAVDEFDETIRTEAGDRSSFDAILTAWLPEAREDFEIKRKQAVFKGISQLKGKVAATNLATALIHPSADGEHLDVVWILGHLGLQRLRPGVMVNFTSRRVPTSHGPGTPTLSPRRPMTLDGVEAQGIDGLLLPECCSTPLPQVRVEAAGDRVHYLLEGNAFGPRSSSDIVFAEVNRAELPRYVAPQLVSDGPRRKRYVYTDVPTPTELLVFDLLIHKDILGDSEPGVMMYDTVTRGIADVNDRARDIDRLDLHASIKLLGAGLSQCRLSEAPWYTALLSRVCDTMSWRAGDLRNYRVRIEYPLYGSQVAITYDAQARPS
jgi:hypothetical protein